MKNREEQRKAGNYYWLVVLSCCGMAAGSIGLCNNTDGIFYSAVCEALGVGRGSIALYTTFSSLATGFIAPIIVGLVSRFKMHHIMRLGVLLTVSSVLLMSLASKPWIFYLLGIMRGIGCACFAAQMFTIVLGNWFTKRRSLFVGIAQSTAGLAAAVFSPVFSQIIERAGYKTAYLVNAALILAFSLPGSFIIRQKPEMIGCEPYGGSAVIDTRKNTKENIAFPKFKAFSAMFIFIVAADWLAVMICQITPHLQSYGMTLGKTATFGATLASAAMVGNVISKAFVGFLCDLIGCIRSMYIILILVMLSLGALLMGVNGNVALIGLTLVVGFIYGATAVCFPEFVRLVYGREQYGNAYAILSMFAYCSSALSVSLIGFVYDALGSYTVVLAGGIACAAMSMVFVFAAYRIFLRKTAR